ncbi:MAG: glycosyltransferase family 2 protein [Butyrivibrio sp.]|nr:glycosyltransferase family 2 protein [Butyrivibrio sp.]
MSKREDIVVSVIIPVYQSKDTVRECVRSCLEQREIAPEQIEVILVDDGSTDGSGEICDKLAYEDERRFACYVKKTDDSKETGGRVRVVHTKNHGVSHARNAGIDEAGGKYLVFVDSDDIVKDGFLKRLLDEADNETALVDETDSFKSQNRVSGFFYIENSVLNRNTHVWGKLFSGDIIRDNRVRFSEELSIGEDLIFLLDFALLQGKKHTIKGIYSGDYVYRENGQGAMKGAFRESYLDELKCWRIAQEKLLPYGRNLSKYAFVSVAASQVMTAFLVAGKIAVMDESEIDPDLRKRAISEVKAQIKHALKTQGAFASLPFGHKIKTIVFGLNSNLYLKLYGSHKSVK